MGEHLLGASENEKSEARLDLAKFLDFVKVEARGFEPRSETRFDHSVYVRIPPIEVSSRWPVDGPLLDKSPKFSPTAGRRNADYPEFAIPLKPPQEGFSKGRCSNS